MSSQQRRVRADAGATVVIVGRPNVGKSTLVNRLTGRRDAIVEQKPGVTRDRTTHAAEWIGRAFTVVDTGGWQPGWQPGLDALDEAVSAQAERATETADLVLFVVDATVGVTEEDAAVAAWVRAGGLPVALVANKVDRARMEAEIAELYGLGLGEPLPVSALHGHGSGDLLDEVVRRLQSEGAFDRPVPPPEGIPGVALIGRPNVGKSSLFNRLLGQERTIVDDRPGTTRDAVDTVVEVEGRGAYRFVDTAGLRRRRTKLDSTEYYSTVRTVQALESAAVALLVVDAEEGIGEQEQKLARQVVDAGRAVVLVLNKWDVVDEYQRDRVMREHDRLLSFVDWAPLVRTSALTGRGIDRLLPAVDAVLAQWSRRIATAEVNTWLADAVAATAPPMAAGHQVRLRYATQVAAGPPTFRVFSTGELSPGYVRYLERRLRERFGFAGTPLHVGVRVRPRWEERAAASGTPSGAGQAGGASGGPARAGGSTSGAARSGGGRRTAGGGGAGGRAGKAGGGRRRGR